MANSMFDKSTDQVFSSDPCAVSTYMGSGSLVGFQCACRTQHPVFQAVAAGGIEGAAAA